MIPEGTVELDGKVYRRKPWRGNFNALVLVGTMEKVTGADGKPTGATEFVPLRQSLTTDPLKASRARARAKRPPKAEAPKAEAKRKPEGGKPSPAPGRK